MLILGRLIIIITTLNKARFSNLYSTKTSSAFWINAVALSFVMFVLIFFNWGAHQINQPISYLATDLISLDYGNLGFYVMRTVFRMIIGIIISIIFSIIYASIALQSKKAEELMIPILDVLQSVPILGYISFTVAGFIAIAPNTMLGFEMAAIFAIFTWNITFCVYQSLKKVPHELLEVAKNYNFNRWRTFWVVKLPYAVPAIVWNSIVSMSGAWFFVVAAESITYNSEQINLPGIGSYIALSLKQQNVEAICIAVCVMAGVILIFDFIVFRALVSWSNKFKYESENPSCEQPSWLINILGQSSLVRYVAPGIKKFCKMIVNINFKVATTHTPSSNAVSKYFNILWYGLIGSLGLYCLYYVVNFLSLSVSLNELAYVVLLTLITFTRLMILLVICSIIFVPLGIYIGSSVRLRQIIQPIIQFLSAFPANLFFPVVVTYINGYNLNPDIWLSPLMLVAAQWYILFNVIAGTAQIPGELLDIIKTFRISGFLKYRKLIIPAIMPYYLTGLITAAGAGWNASIIAEAVKWGNQSIYAHGIGSYITQMTQQNDFHRIALGVIVMSGFVVIFNKLFWSRAYTYVTNKFSYI